jgi:hypothetical protein
MTELSAQQQLPRFRIQLPLLYKRKGPPPERVGVAWSRDLSEGGACVELAECLRPKTGLHVRVQTEQGAIEAEAQVVWTAENDSSGGRILHGVAFTSFAPNHRQILRALLLSKGQVRDAGVRLPLEIPVTFRRRGEPGLPLEGRTGDLSSGGLSLRLCHALPAGTVLELTLHLPRGPLSAEGTVVWVEPARQRPRGEPIRHGLQFAALGWTTSLSLGLFLAEPLQGNLPAAPCSTSAGLATAIGRRPASRPVG